MPPPARAITALEAMKVIGFRSKEAGPVLKKLLKVYDNNWEYIEQDGYQVLIDGILEEQESKAKEQDAVVGDNQDNNSRKRLKKPGQTDPSQSKLHSDAPSENLRKMPKEEDDVPPITKLNGRRAEPISPVSADSVHDYNKWKMSRHNLPQSSSNFENVGPDSILRDGDFITKINNSEPSFDVENEGDLLEPVPIAIIPPPKDYIFARNEAHQGQPSQDNSFVVESLAIQTVTHTGNNGKRKIGSSNLENGNSTKISRPPHDLNDITKGEESIRVSLVNDVSNEKYPSSFHYIPWNTVHKNARVNISLSRIGDKDCCSNCFGDCVSAESLCACAQITGGDFAYTSDGLVKETFLDECISINCDPHKHYVYCQDCPLERCKSSNDVSGKCKGHLVRKFIKECWSKCGCSKQCKNRVVQRGISHNLQVFFTPEGKGWGLRTLDELPKGAFVCEYVGEILTIVELYNRTVKDTDNGKNTFPVLLDADWGSKGVLEDEDALCLDATFYGNVARFINHRCGDANLVAVPVEVEAPDHNYHHIAFFTSRKIELYEELTWDFGINFDDVGHSARAFKCRCGSKLCRDGRRTRSRSKALVLR